MYENTSTPTQVTNSTKIKWIISSTGVKNYGSRVSSMITSYLKDKNFTIALLGEPTYTTNNPYTDDEMYQIALHVQKIRNDAHPHQNDRTKVMYWKVANEYAL